MKSKFINLRLFLFVIIIFVIAFFLWTIVGPTGQVVYRQDFQNDNYYRLGKIKPVERTLPVTATGQTILGGPVYFTLNTSRPWKKAEVVLRYRTSPNFKHSQIELGLLTNKQQWQYLLQPLGNSLLDETLQRWIKVASGSEVLLQRRPTYSSLEAFKAKPPVFGEIAVYNDTLNYAPDFTTATSGQANLQVPLIGGYQFFTVVNNGELDLKLGFNELKNQNITTTKTELLLYQGRNLVKLIDLSAKRAEAVSFGWWVYTLTEKNLAQGFYKVELRSDDNLVTKSLELNQNRLAFAGHLQIGEVPVNGLKLWTDSREVSFLARSAESVGDVFINGERQVVGEAYRQFSFTTAKHLNELKIVKPGLELSGDGVFAFEPAELFNPRLKQIDYLTNLDREGINYILANYTPPTKAQGWTTATTSFDFTRAVPDTDGFKFMLSIPGFKDKDQVADWLEIGSIEVKMTGETPLQYLRKWLRRVISKVLIS
jgi:hypothetical protein